MRRRKHKNKKIMLTSFILLICLAVGYSAFNTIVNLKAKGNIKKIFEDVEISNNDPYTTDELVISFKTNYFKTTLNSNDISLYINNEETMVITKDISSENIDRNYKKYKLTLKNILGEGKLKLKIKDVTLNTNVITKLNDKINIGLEGHYGIPLYSYTNTFYLDNVNLLKKLFKNVTDYGFQSIGTDKIINDNINTFIYMGIFWGEGEQLDKLYNSNINIVSDGNDIKSISITKDYSYESSFPAVTAIKNNENQFTKSVGDNLNVLSDSGCWAFKCTDDAVSYYSYNYNNDEYDYACYMNKNNTKWVHSLIFNYLDSSNYYILKAVLHVNDLL